MNAFRIGEGNTISMEMLLNASKSGDKGWKSLVVPFAPAKVTDAAGNKMTQYIRDAVSNPNGLYMTASLDADGSLSLTNGIAANTPYLVGLYQEDGTVIARFVAEECEVPQTPEEIKIEGSDYTLAATLSRRALPAENTYLLNEDGSAFAACGDSVSAKPFSVYAASDSGAPIFPVDVDVAMKEQGGITSPEGTPSFLISREGNVLVITSGCDTTIDLFNIAGQHVKTLRLIKGRNIIDDLEAGVYLIRGQKVVL